MMIKIFFIILPLSFLPWTTSSSFSLKLIHRDSPLSPLYNPNLTDIERLSKHAEITQARASYFEQQTDSYAAQDVSIRLPARLEEPLFTVEIGIGTPSLKRTLIFDTGSGLTWTQCKPCFRCFKQKEPLYDTKRSSTYKKIGKKHPLSRGFTCTPFGCGYYIGYYSGQYSAGFAAVESFTFQSNLKTPTTVSNLVFGCGTSNVGKYPPEISGILGMDKEAVSFAQQLGSAIKARFSYCLSPLTSNTTTSYVRFGDEARIRGRNGQKTPFLINNSRRSNTVYMLNLIDLSFNGRKLGVKFPDGCFVDTGASVSLLNKRAFAAVRDFMATYFSKFKNVVRYSGNKVPKNFICYSYPAGFTSFPTLTFHFKGADYYVMPSNLFLFIHGNYFCLMIMESKDTTILGAYQQMNVRFVYDLKERTISFAPEECSRDLQLGS